MKRKQPIYKGLNNTPVFYTDTSKYSYDIFDIIDLPKRLTAGKNILRLRGNLHNLSVNAPIEVEILDYNNKPIYTEMTSYVGEDGSRIISIYIYPTTPPGTSTITLLTKINQINNVIVPSEWKDRINAKWTTELYVNPLIQNDSEIIFDKLPNVTIEEHVGVQLNRTYTTSQFPTYSTGTVRYKLTNNQPTIISDTAVFNKNMEGGTITVSNPESPIPNSLYAFSAIPYVSKIKKILSTSSLLLETPYNIASTHSIVPHTYSGFENSNYSITYEDSPTYVATENSESFALIKIDNLQPITGDVSRIKVFINNTGNVSTWEQVNDIELDETEIFVTNTASLTPDVSIGDIVSQTTIDTYYTAITYNNHQITTSPTLTYNTTNLINSIRLTNNIDITLDSAASILQINDAFAGTFYKDSTYKITLDSIGYTLSDNHNARMLIYLSGSAFNQDYNDTYYNIFPKPLGKRIGELNVIGDTQLFLDNVFNFTADNDGTGNLIFLILNGDWNISNISTKSDNDLGYTPNYTRIRTFIPTVHKSNVQLNFKIEYYNIAGNKSKQINYCNNIDWVGGNRYIDGDYSMITGSLYIGHNLQTGLGLSGYHNTGYIRSLGYNGFISANPGFLLWSGSALPSSAGTKGNVAYSGVGLELYANSNNYFRYATNPSELDIRTKTFFLGSTSPANFISGSNNKLQISSSAFELSPEGSVTASSFIARSGSLILFDSNAKYADAFNIGRIIYFDKNESSIADLSLTVSENTAATMSVFQTYILPGETSIGASFTYKHHNNSSINACSIRYHAYIQSASLGPISDTSGYGLFSTPERITTSTGYNGISFTGTGDRSGLYNINLIPSTSSILSKFWGKYVQIYLTAHSPSTSPDGNLYLKNFVYKSSRVLASITSSYLDAYPGDVIEFPNFPPMLSE